MPFVHKGYQFTKDKDIADGAVVSWRCTQRRQQQCTARIHVSMDDNEVVAEFGAHNHDSPGEEAASSASACWMPVEDAVTIDEEDAEEESLADQLRATEAENKRLRGELAGKKQQLIDQKLELQAMRQRVADADPEKTSLQRKVNDLQSQLLKSLETSKAVAEAKRRLREENAQWKHAQEAWKATESKLKEEAETATARASQFERELKDLRTAWEEKKAKELILREALKNEHDRKEAELRKHLEDAEQKASKLADELTAQKQRAADDEADLRFLLCQQTQDLFVAQKQLATFRKHPESLNRSHAKAVEGDLEAVKAWAIGTESELRRELASRDQSLDQTMRRLEGARKEVDELNEAVKELKDEKNHFEDTVETLKGDLKSAKFTAAATEAELRIELEEAVEKLKDEKNRLQDKAETLEGDLETLKGTADATESGLRSELAETVSKLTEEKNRLENTVETLEGDFEALKATAAATESELRKELASRDQTLSQATRRLEDAQKKVDEFTEDVANISDDKSRLEDTTEYLRNNLRLTEEQRRQSGSRVEELEKQLDELKNEMAALKASERSREVSENAFGDLQTRFDELSSENVRLTAEVGVLHGAADKKDAEVCDRLSQFMAELTADGERILEENRMLKEENVALKEQVEDARQRAEEEPESVLKPLEELQDVTSGALDEQVEATRKELSDRSAECEVLKQWLQKDREQKSALEEKVEELEDELAAMKVKLERTRAKLAEQRRISEPVQDLLQAEAKRLLERTTVDSNSNFATQSKPVNSSSASDAWRLDIMGDSGEEPTTM